MDLNTNSQTILLVDDDRAVRTVVKAYLERASYAVLTATDGEEGLEVFRRRQDCIALLITDVVMPKMSGLQLAEAALRVRPHLPVLFISGNAQHVDRGHGCLAKPFTSAELVSRVRHVLGNSTERENHNGSGRVETPPHPLARLTMREQEVLRLLCDGFTSKTIAQKLGISLKTAICHRSRILQKVGVHETVSLVRFAIRSGYIEA